MSSYEISLEAVLCDEGCTEDEISATFDALMEALVDLGVQDPFVGGSLATRRIEITLVVDAASDEVAFALGSRFIAKAMEKAGIRFEQKPAPSTGLSWSSTSIRPAV